MYGIVAKWLGHRACDLGHVPSLDESVSDVDLSADCQRLLIVSASCKRLA